MWVFHHVIFDETEYLSGIFSFKQIAAMFMIANNNNNNTIIVFEESCKEDDKSQITTIKGWRSLHFIA